MNDFPSQTSESGGSLWPCCQCQDCQHRKECPYVFDRVICHAAHQGQAEAQRLAGEADRFLETVSQANDLESLLDGSRDLERALSQALASEMTQLDSLGIQTAQQCP